MTTEELAELADAVRQAPTYAPGSLIWVTVPEDTDVRQLAAVLGSVRAMTQCEFMLTRPGFVVTRLGNTATREQIEAVLIALPGGPAEDVTVTAAALRDAFLLIERPFVVGVEGAVPPPS